MKVSKLIDDQTVARILEAGVQQRDLLSGRAGRSTGEALEKIGQAMTHPETDVPLARVDPWGQWFKGFVCSKIEKLGLEHFVIVVRGGVYYLRYDIYRDIEI